MNIAEKIKAKQKLKKEINSFFESVCHYYKTNTVKWNYEIDFSKYSFSHYEEDMKENELQIYMSTPWHDYIIFDVSDKILKKDDWKSLVDVELNKEKAKYDEERKEREKQITDHQQEELQQLEKLASKYGKTVV